MNRVWFYSYRRWLPGLLHYFWPYFGSDERGRRTIVLHIPPFGFVCIAYWTCKCPTCTEARRDYAKWEVSA